MTGVIVIVTVASGLSLSSPISASVFPLSCTLKSNVCCVTSSNEVLKNIVELERVNGKSPISITEPLLLSDNVPVEGKAVNLYVNNCVNSGSPSEPVNIISVSLSSIAVTLWSSATGVSLTGVTST